MKADSSICHGADLEQWQRARRQRALAAFAPAALFSTLAGSSAVFVGLWPVASHGLLAAWYHAGLLLVVVQALMWRALHEDETGPPEPRRERRRRCWLAAGSLSTGLFWCVASLALFPENAPAYQIFVACVVAAVTALWLPLFALERLALATVAAPALLPMAFKLLNSPSASMTTMGSVLFLLFAAVLAITFLFERVLEADCASQRALYHRATHDALVGLVNHAEFHRRLRALRSAPCEPCAVVFIDLDDFKDVNDTAGHAEGDRVLREVGSIVRQEIRKADTGARIGGDEFAVLMQLCTDQEARRVAVAILERIRALRVGGDAGMRVTASIGIACSTERGICAHGVLEAADQACYAAKRAGRNRIEMAALRSAAATAGRSTAPADEPGQRQVIPLGEGSKSKAARELAANAPRQLAERWDPRSEGCGRL